MAKANKKEIVSSVVQNLIVTILLALIGIWGSRLFDKLLDSPDSFVFDREVWIFCLLFIIFVIMFTWMLVSRELRTLAAQKELIRQSEKLEETIRTLPPEGFLDQFSEKYGEAHGVYKSLLLSGDGITRKEIEYATRGILLGILRLTEFFDRGGDGVSYGANIMVFTDAYKTDKKLRPELLKNLKFVYEDLDPDKLKGVLYLTHELSTSSIDTDSSPDEAIKKILLTLPVPAEVRSKETQKFKALPGAPLAIALNSPNIYSNTETLDEWVKEQGDFNKTIAAQVKEYFGSGVGKEIKSFCSLPLSCDGEEPMAVLNVHKDEVALLAQRDQLALYGKIMSPFLAMLAEFVKRWCELKD